MKNLKRTSQTMIRKISMGKVMFGSTFQLHVCVFLQQITGTHAPKRGNGSWTWRNATHERKTGNAK